MTNLETPVRRRSRAPFGHYRRRIVVALEPGDILAMRLERTRTTFRAPLAAVYRQLVEWHVQARRRDRRNARTTQEDAVKRMQSIDVRTARFHYPNGEVEHFTSQTLALAVWLALPKGARTAFRGAHDARPVYPWDYADKS